MFWTGMVFGGIGSLWLAINAFRTTGALWGISALIVPFVAQFYGLRHLDDNTVPLILSLVGIVLCVLGQGNYPGPLAAI